MSEDNSVTILGCRGSVPVSGRAFRKYGGATTCFAVRLGGQLAVIDAGTGLLHLSELPGEKTGIPLILTHGHMDHLLGLPMCPAVFSAETELRIFTDCPQALQALMAPPLWPVSPEDLPARILISDLPQQFSIGPIEVQTMPGCHPGGVKLLRLRGGGVSVTVMTDCTLSGHAPALLAFAKNSDLLLIDGQFSPSEWSDYAAFGHNSWEMAAQFARDCGARQTRIIHHAPSREDESLDAAAAALEAYGRTIQFGYEKEMILL